MVRKKIEKSKDAEPKQIRGRRKQQTQQVVKPAFHYPMETSDPFTGMFNMMMAILMPMLKGINTK